MTRKCKLQALAGHRFISQKDKAHSTQVESLSHLHDEVAKNNLNQYFGDTQALIHLAIESRWWRWYHDRGSRLHGNRVR